MRGLILATALVAGLALSGPADALQRLSDAEVRQRIIEQSIRGYSGNCPCPYSTNRAGRRCGGNSAYSRPGGASPKCFPQDVTDAEVRAWRQGMGVRLTYELLHLTAGNQAVRKAAHDDIRPHKWTSEPVSNAPRLAGPLNHPAPAFIAKVL